PFSASSASAILVLVVVIVLFSVSYGVATQLYQDSRWPPPPRGQQRALTPLTGTQSTRPSSPPSKNSMPSFGRAGQNRQSDSSCSERISFSAPGKLAASVRKKKATSSKNCSRLAAISCACAMRLSSGAAPPPRQILQLGADVTRASQIFCS